MKCLVTGASGFIGSHLVKELERRGHDVGKVKGESLVNRLVVPNYDGYKPDYIFHLAAYGNMANQNDDDKIFFSNLLGAYNLLHNTKNIPYKAFINVSSSSVTLPHETIYSATKAGAERLCKAFHDEYNKPIISVRPYSVYGPGEADFRFIPTAFRACLEGKPLTLDPDATHDWIYIDDVVNLLIGYAENMIAPGSTFELGTGFSTTNKDIVEMIEQITGKKAKIKLAKKPLRSFDTRGWVCKNPIAGAINIFDGLRNYYHWYIGLSK